MPGNSSHRSGSIENASTLWCLGFGLIRAGGTGKGQRVTENRVSSGRTPWRLVSPPLSPVVLVGFLVLAALLSGCRSSSEHGAPAASSSSATQSPIAVQPAEGTRYRVTATILVGARPAGVAVDSSTHTVYVANDNGTLYVTNEDDERLYVVERQ